MTVCAVETDVAGLVPEWARLAERAAATPFSFPDWVLAWREAFAPGAELHAAAVRRDGELVALAPLLRGTVGLRGPANSHTPRLELLAADDRARTALCLQIFGARPRSITLRLLSGDAADAFDSCAADCGYIRLRRPFPSPAIDLEGLSWEDYWSSRRADLRGDVRRRWRRLRELGEVDVDACTGGSRLREFLREGFTVEASGWKGRAGTAILSRPETRRFYTRLALAAAERGWLRLFLIRLGGRAIAFSYGLEYQGVHHNLKVGYDESLRNCSPGKLLAAVLVERSFSRGLRRYEFCGSPEPYKLAWANGTSTTYVTQAFAPTPVGVGGFFACALARPVAKRALGFLER